MIAAGALMVIDTDTSPRSMPENSVCMSSSVSTATPSRPTSPSERCVVGVVAHQRGHVEGRREAGLAVVEQVAEALVGLLARAEAGELAHRPQPPAVHRLVDAARERVGARAPDRVLGAADPRGQVLGACRARARARRRACGSCGCPPARTRPPPWARSPARCCRPAGGAAPTAMSIQCCQSPSGASLGWR